MSAAAEAEDVDEDEVEVEEPSEEAADEQAADTDDGEQPPVDEDERADLSDLAAKVQAETSPDTSDQSDDDDDVDGDQSEDAETDDAEDAASSAETDSGESYGDMYVQTLCSVSNAVIDEYGDEDTEDVDPEMARQLGLDDAIDELMAQRGQPDMPPEHQVLIGTLVFAVTVAGAKTDLFDRILAEADL